MHIVGFSELKEGIFYRNIENLDDSKLTKLKLVKSKKQEKFHNFVFSSRKSSFHDSFYEVIIEDPEMELSLNSSESEEKIGLNEDFNKKSLPISKLPLEKITEKST